MNNSEHLANVMVQCFIRAVEEGLDLLPVVADSTSTSKIKPFVERFPDRIVNVGIAEQVMVGTAAGLALGGKIACTCNAAPFLISRANEQVKIDVCYNNTNVKLFGLNAGASYGALASTHHSIDDISIMRGFGNIEIYAPSCPLEAQQVIDYSLRSSVPTYIRMDGKPLPYLHPLEYRFWPGKIDVLREGELIALVGLGSTVHEVVEAAGLLAGKGHSPGVLSISSIRPCDRDALAAELKKYKMVVSAEEHNINGGVGSLVAEVIAERGLSVQLKRLGIPDGGYAIAGDRASTRQYHQIDAKGIAQVAESLLFTL